MTAYARRMLTVAVLGPVEVHRDGVRLPVPSGKTTEVLVRLALDAGRPVRADRLIEDLWAERRRHGPQHAAVEGVPAAPGPAGPPRR